MQKTNFQCTRCMVQLVLKEAKRFCPRCGEFREEKHFEELPEIEEDDD